MANRRKDPAEKMYRQVCRISHEAYAAMINAQVPGCRGQRTSGNGDTAEMIRTVVDWGIEWWENGSPSEYVDPQVNRYTGKRMAIMVSFDPDVKAYIEALEISGCPHFSNKVRAFIHWGLESMNRMREVA